ncbi:unnamed protein product [Owenia fusiformis]|uniref:Delta-like protein n=1 Tax=Owenia fusiformis TaxID=6347 RepID=A0A8S4N0R6_OWEFU|nr:unnamed protein product [Owenia fusiformis]
MPCFNNATCNNTDDGGGFNCTCKNGYFGEFCDQENACILNSPCLNNSTCNLTDAGNVTCLCSDGFTGEFCQNVDGCSIKPCLHNGTCNITDFDGGYNCSCLTGYSGINCELYDTCILNTPCLNNGTCFNSTYDGNFTCLCTESFTGERCETNIMLGCDLTPCLNNATCINTDILGGYECNCTDGYTDVNCSTKVLPGCDSSPCQNNGTCEDSSNGEINCTCADGFSGDFCERSIADPCLSEPCPNNATCTGNSNLGNYSCLCPDDFYGDACEIYCRAKDDCTGHYICNTTDGSKICIPDYGGELCVQPMVDLSTCPPPVNATANDFSGIWQGSYQCDNGVNFTFKLTLYQDELSSLNGRMEFMSSTQEGSHFVEGFVSETSLIASPGEWINEGSNKFSISASSDSKFANLTVSVYDDECNPNNHVNGFAERLQDQCLNNGSCIRGESSEYGDFECCCPNNFSGRFCETPLGCNSDPCQNGGVCHENSNGSPNCTCADNYYGPLCDVYCEEEDTCNGHFKCNEVGAKVCLLGWSGNNCKEADPSYSHCPSNTNFTDVKGSWVANYMCDGKDMTFELHVLIQSGDFWTGAVDLYDAGVFIGNHSIILLLREDGEMSLIKTSWIVNPGSTYSDISFFGASIDEDFKTIRDGEMDCDDSPLTIYRKSEQKCQNGGQCARNGTSEYCCCPEGFDGVSCEIQISPCDLNSCPNNATCNATSATTYDCICPEGFTGPTCQTPLPCSATPCFGNATCFDNPDGNFTCDCPEYFTGVTCDMEINPCESSPCQNNGTCENGLFNNYTCNCLSSFGGDNCETEKTKGCKPTSCLNNGTCYENDNGFGTCNCTSYFTGQKCETPLYCASNPCFNEATCVEGSGNFTCECTNMYMGPLCNETIPDICDPNQCYNNATCIDLTDGNFTCNCTGKFEGKFCNVTKMTMCDLKPCDNNGTCIDLPDGNFTCNCTEQFMGVRCNETVPMPCDAKPCYNNATCVNLPDGNYTCNCTEFFNGTLCNESIPYGCQLQQCENNATCEDIENRDFLCICPTNFTGRYCENEILFGCESAPCLNNGTCNETSIGGEFECTCSNYFYGNVCDVYCKPQDTCRGHYTCDENGGKVCLDGWRGDECTTRVDDRDFCPKELPTDLSGTWEGSMVCNGSSVSILVNINRYNLIHNGTISFTIHEEEIYTYTNTFSGIYQPEPERKLYLASGDWVGDPPSVYSPIGLAISDIDYNDTMASQAQIDVLGDNGCTNLTLERQGFCKNKGKCLVDTIGGENSKYCCCLKGFKGRNCEIRIMPCDSSPCFNNGTCENVRYDNFTCTCSPGWGGKQCDADIPKPCENDPCSNNATCENIDAVNFNCKCLPDTTGETCETEIKPGCSSSPCENNATCTDSNFGHNVTCNCTELYTGETCGVRITMCNESSCLNGGTCEEHPTMLAFTCNCSTNYTGDRCETEIIDCDPNPCLNGATCNATGLALECICPPQFAGERCNECKAGFTGDLCDEPVNACASSPCKHNGTCENVGSSYECNCTDGYSGQNCQIPPPSDTSLCLTTLLSPLNYDDIKQYIKMKVLQSGLSEVTQCNCDIEIELEENIEFRNTDGDRQWRLKYSIIGIDSLGDASVIELEEKFKVGEINVQNPKGDNYTLCEKDPAYKPIDELYTVYLNRIPSLLPIANLTEAIKTCWENKGSVTNCTRARADLAILIDSSSSVIDSDFEKVKLFAKNVIRDLSGDFSIAVVTFSDDVTIHFKLGEYPEKVDMYTQIDLIPRKSGSTNTKDLFERLPSEIMGPNNRNDAIDIALLITDGASKDGPIDSAVATAKAANIEVFVVGVETAELSERELELIASDPIGEHLFMAANFSTLPKVTYAIEETSCVENRTVTPNITITQYGFVKEYTQDRSGVWKVFYGVVRNDKIMDPNTQSQPDLRPCINLLSPGGQQFEVIEEKAKPCDDEFSFYIDLEQIFVEEDIDSFESKAVNAWSMTISPSACSWEDPAPAFIVMKESYVIWKYDKDQAKCQALCQVESACKAIQWNEGECKLLNTALEDIPKDDLSFNSDDDVFIQDCTRSAQLMGYTMDVQYHSTELYIDLDTKTKLYRIFYFLLVNNTCTQPEIWPTMNTTYLTPLPSFTNGQYTIIPPNQNLVVSYDKHFESPLHRKARETDFPRYEEVLTEFLKAKNQNDSRYDTLRVYVYNQIRTIDEDGNDGWALIYFVRINPFLSPDEIPELPDLGDITNITSLNRDETVSLEDAHSIYLPHWLSRLDFGKINMAIETTIRESNNKYENTTEYKTRVDPAIRDEYVTADGDLQTRYYFFFIENNNTKKLGEIRPINLTNLNSKLNFNSPREYQYRAVNGEGLEDYGMHHSLILSRPILTKDLDAIGTKLREVWVNKAGGSFNVTGLNVIRQDEALNFVNKSDATYWELAYFVEENGKLLSPEIDSANKNAVKLKLNEYTASGVKYGDALLSTLDVNINEPNVYETKEKLFKIIVSPVVSESDYPEFETQLSDIWTNQYKEDFHQPLNVSICGSQTRMDKQGNIMSELLYRVNKLEKPKFTLYPMDVSDPPLNSTTLKENLHVNATNGEAYVITTNIQTRRPEKGYTVLLDKWVQDSDKDKLKKAIVDTWVQEKNMTAEAVSVEIWNQYKVVDPTCNDYVKLLYFVSVNDVLVDAMLVQWTNENMVALKTKISEEFGDKYMAVQDRYTWNILSAFTVYVKGRISDSQLPKFEEAVKSTFQENVTVKVCGAELYIGDRWELITGIKAFVTMESELLHSVLYPPLDLDELETSLNKNRKKRDTASGTISLYSGLRKDPYDDFFNLPIATSIILTKGDADKLFDGIKAAWTTKYPELDDVTISLGKVEDAVGKLGVMVYNVLYGLYNDGEKITPKDASAPTYTDLVNVSTTPQFMAYSETITITSTVYSPYVGGNLIAANREYLETGLNSTWEDSSIKILGAIHHANPTDSFDRVSQVLYSAHKDNVMLKPWVNAGPSINELNNWLSERNIDGLNSYGGARPKRVWSVMVNEPNTKSDEDIKQAIQEAWNSNIEAGEPTIEIIGEERYTSQSGSWNTLKKVTYIASLEDATYTELYDVPSAGDIQCDCMAKQAYRLFLKKSDSEVDVQSMKDALQKAWKTANSGVDDITINVHQDVLDDDTSYINDDHESVTGFTYTVTVEGADPSPVFIRPPTNDQIKSALTESDFTPCDCNPKRKGSIMVTPNVLPSEVDSLEDDMKKAILDANPGFTEDDLEVEITDFKNDKQTSSGDLIGTIEYTIQSKLGNDVSDIVLPTIDQWDAKISSTNKAIYTGQMMDRVINNALQNNWVIIVIVCSVVVGVILLILVLVKFLSLRKQEKLEEKDLEKRTKEIQESNYHDNEQFSETPKVQQYQTRDDESWNKVLRYEARIV